MKTVAYRESEIGLLARVDPRRAREQILSAYRKTEGDMEATALCFGITRRTLDRISKTLKLQRQIVELRRTIRAARKAA